MHLYTRTHSLTNRTLLLLVFSWLQATKLMDLSECVARETMNRQGEKFVGAKAPFIQAAASMWKYSYTSIRCYLWRRRCEHAPPEIGFKWLSANHQFDSTSSSIRWCINDDHYVRGPGAHKQSSREQAQTPTYSYKYAHKHHFTNDEKQNGYK